MEVKVRSNREGDRRRIENTAGVCDQAKNLCCQFVRIEDAVENRSGDVFFLKILKESISAAIENIQPQVFNRHVCENKESRLRMTCLDERKMLLKQDRIVTALIEHGRIGSNHATILSHACVGACSLLSQDTNSRSAGGAPALHRYNGPTFLGQY